jgi:hypothetical protein
MLAASIVALAMAGMQVFIGGTRMAFALPVYAFSGWGVCSLPSLGVR